VIEGELRFKLAGDVQYAPAGAFVFVLRGTPHCFQNVAEAPARILVMFTPAGMERFFDGFAALSEPDPEAFGRIGGPLGMTVVDRRWRSPIPYSRPLHSYARPRGQPRSMAPAR
jgi:hypothetical protein